VEEPREELARAVPPRWLHVPDVLVRPAFRGVLDCPELRADRGRVGPKRTCWMGLTGFILVVLSRSPSPVERWCVCAYRG
jgi:hypothetical protein